MRLRDLARGVNSEALIAQRRKRLVSIENKLALLPTKLPKMQDIGGCRAIVEDVTDVWLLANQYDKSAAQVRHGRSRRIKVNDYINKPRDTGYRSLHYVYEYDSDSPKYEPYKGLRIEIQIRTKLQHLWATAVETVSAYTGHALKSNLGDDRWLRFFVLMSSVFALRENCPVVPNTSENLEVLREELMTLSFELNALDVLFGCKVATQYITKEVPKAHNFLLLLNSDTHTIAVTPFRKGNKNGPLRQSDKPKRVTRIMIVFRPCWSPWNPFTV